MRMNSSGSAGKRQDRVGNREVYLSLLLVFFDTFSGCLKQIIPSSVLKSFEISFLSL